jgi:DNA-binding NarL/FixJ family response regulator
MRILLADHHPQALWALKLSLETMLEMDVIGEATDAETLCALVAGSPPDLALVDWELPGKPIEDLIKELHESQPRPIVVVMGSQPEYGRMVLRAGADAFVSKSDQPDWLLQILHKYARRTQKKAKPTV